MKRSLRLGLGLASVALSLGLMGCGGSGIDGGLPEDPKRVDIPLDPKMVDVSGKMGVGAASKATQEPKQKAPSATPGGETPAPK